jgi:NAD(P)H-hydrate epimerase
MGTPFVITPHPGEAAMLLESETRAVQADRLAAIEALGERFPGGWILLKGYRSLIRSPEGALYVCGSGGASLAVAGSGDVLSGMIGALLAQRFEARDAVLLACLRHGMAGDRWCEHHRDYSMLAEDIITDLVD